MKVDITGSLPNISLTGANTELLTELLLASFRKDTNGLGLLRVYLENKLSASDGDTIGLDGVLANKLERMPSGEFVTQLTNQTVLANNDPSYADNVIIDVQEYIEITSMQIVSWTALSNLMIFVYDNTGSGTYERLATSFTYATNALSLQDVGATGMGLYSHPQFSAKQLDSGTVKWEFANRNGARLTFPYGIKIFMKNTTTTPYNFAAVVKYQKYEVTL